jgi:hypothetical protein
MSELFNGQAASHQTQRKHWIARPDSALRNRPRIKFRISDHVMPAQAGTQFFSIRCEVRWVPACAGMTETNHSWFKS